MNIIAAFLAENLDEKIYMKQSKEFRQGIEEEDLVCLLQKSLYDLKQTSRVWNQRIRRFLLSKEYQQMHSNHYVYIHPVTKVIIAI